METSVGGVLCCTLLYCFSCPLPSSNAHRLCSAIRNIRVTFICSCLLRRLLLFVVYRCFMPFPPPHHLNQTHSLKWTSYLNYVIIIHYSWPNFVFPSHLMNPLCLDPTKVSLFPPPINVFHADRPSSSICYALSVFLHTTYSFNSFHGDVFVHVSDWGRVESERVRMCHFHFEGLFPPRLLF